MSASGASGVRAQQHSGLDMQCSGPRCGRDGAHFVTARLHHGAHVAAELHPAGFCGGMAGSHGALLHATCDHRTSKLVICVFFSSVLITAPARHGLQLRSCLCASLVLGPNSARPAEIRACLLLVRLPEPLIVKNSARTLDCSDLLLIPYLISRLRQ